MTPERWLVTGASGKLGGAVLEILAHEVPPERILALSGHRTGSIAGVSLQPAGGGWGASVSDFHPTHVLHLAGVTSIAACREDPLHARAVNVDATESLCRRIQSSGAHFVFTSTDMVFAGDDAPYDEAAPPNPLSLYGRTKMEAEAALRPFESVAVVRVGLLVGPSPGPGGSAYETLIESLRAGTPQPLFMDEVRTPLSPRDAARALVAVARGRLQGTLHLGGPERLSRLEIGERIAAAARAGRAVLVPTSRLEFEAADPRPADLSLDSTRLVDALPEFAPRVLSAGSLA